MMGSTYDFLSTLAHQLPEPLLSSLARIREKSRGFLHHIVEIFPEYTDHSVDHPDRAAHILDGWLLDGEQKARLLANPWENFFLHAALYLHDLGMVVHPDIDDRSRLLSEADRAHIRDTHHERSFRLIKRIWRDLGIEDEFQADIIARVCLGHRKLPLTDERINRSVPYGSSGHSIDLSFLTACVRLADELDLTFKRTPAEMYGLLRERTRTTRREWGEHFSVGGVGPHDKFQGTILVRCLCRDPDIHRALKQHESKMQLMLNEINRHITPRFSFTQVAYEIEADGYVPLDYRFRVDVSTALQILVGSSLYHHKAVFLRELLQNALDACTLRKLDEPALVPEITVEVVPRERVTVRDNGVGMDRQRIEKYLLPVGISFYRSEEFLSTGAVQLGFHPISAFGIGLLSCFTVASKVVIRTRRLHSEGIELAITDPEGYFDVTVGGEWGIGTEVVVYLKEAVDCLSYLLDNAIATSSPIRYVYCNGEHVTLGDGASRYIDNLRRRYWDAKWRDFIEADIPFPQSVGSVALGVVVRDTRIEGPAKHGNPSLTLLQDGLLVCDAPGLVPDWVRSDLVGRMNLVGGDRLELAMSRNAINPSCPQYEYVKEYIEAGVVRLVTKLFDQIIAENSEASLRYGVMRKFLDECFAPSDAIADVLRTRFPMPVTDRRGRSIAYLTCDELAQRNQKVGVVGRRMTGLGVDLLIQEPDARLVMPVLTRDLRGQVSVEW